MQPGFLLGSKNYKTVWPFILFCLITLLSDFLVDYLL